MSKPIRLGLREARLWTRELRLLGVAPETIGTLWGLTVIGGFVLFMIGYLVFQAPQDAEHRKTVLRAEELAKQEDVWRRQHFEGWREYYDWRYIGHNAPYPDPTDMERGIIWDRLERRLCTSKEYPGYPTCPPQEFYKGGKLQMTMIPGTSGKDCRNTESILVPCGLLGDPPEMPEEFRTKQ